MADCCRIVNSLDLELTCPVCRGLFSEPVTLPCGHAFCKACLKESATLVSGGSGGGHCCPKCKESFQGLGSLPKNDMLCRKVEGYKRTAGDGVSLPSQRTQHQHQEEVGQETTQQQQLQQQQDGQGAETQAGDCCPSNPDLASAQTTRAANQVAEILSSVQLEDTDVTAKLNPTTLACHSTELDPALKREVDEGRIRLSGLVEELEVKLACAASLLLKETEKQSEVRTAHGELWEKVSVLLQKMADLIEAYRETGTELIEAQLKPIEDAVDARVRHISGVHSWLKDAWLQADALLKERDDAAFRQGLSAVEPLISGLVKVPLEKEKEKEEDAAAPATASARQEQQPEECASRPPNLASVCAELERQNSQLRAELSAAQRDLRSILNPSEVTFDPETLHPSLVLSEDLKSVSYSAAKQPYPPHAKRFTSFMQVLSSQVFGESFGVAGGEHCWELDLSGCPSWVVGVCYGGGGLPRMGMASALESSAGCWCLMYCDNLLRVYEQKKPTQLKRTTSVRGVQVRLSFAKQSVAFYMVSSIDGKKTHLHTSEVIAFTEPLHLAVRMMSGQPKARITLLSS